MKNSFYICICFLILSMMISCNDSQKATQFKLPSDTLAVDVSETQTIVPVEVKGDSTYLPVKSPK